MEGRCQVDQRIVCEEDTVETPSLLRSRAFQVGYCDGAYLSDGTFRDWEEDLPIQRLHAAPGSALCRDESGIEREYRVDEIA